MPKKTRDYHSWRLAKLADPEIAEGYLNAALQDSPQMFLKALLNVTQAQENVAAIAKKSGIKRETIYRAFSQNGNPTLDTLNAVLQALGFRIQVATQKAPSPAEPADHKARRRAASRKRA
jgi:probable addiction module antidote protein